MMNLAGNSLLPLEQASGRIWRQKDALQNKQGWKHTVGTSPSAWGRTVSETVARGHGWLTEMPEYIEQKEKSFRER